MASGGGAGSALPSPDQSDTYVNLSAAAGKVALVVGTTALWCGSADAGCPVTSFLDLVGYGSSATDFEGSGPATPANTAGDSVERKQKGCVDTKDNHADFENPSLAADPRNSSTAANACGSAPVDGGDDGGSVPPVDASEGDANIGPPSSDSGASSRDASVPIGESPPPSSGEEVASASSGCSCRAAGRRTSPWEDAGAIFASAFFVLFVVRARSCARDRDGARRTPRIPRRRP
jgi:hypothetical protein